MCFCKNVTMVNILTRKFIKLCMMLIKMVTCQFNKGKKDTFSMNSTIIQGITAYNKSKNGFKPNKMNIEK